VILGIRHSFRWQTSTLVSSILVSLDFNARSVGHDLEQTIAQLKSSERMRCPGCGVGINIDTNRLANAADEIQKAIEKVPPEITIRFYR
jgi:hypothetical protein